MGGRVATMAGDRGMSLGSAIFVPMYSILPDPQIVQIAEAPVT